MAPRPGLTPGRVVEAAVQVVDHEGHDQLTLGRVAAVLGVRTPSLYNHVDGLDDLRRRLTVRALQDLGAAIQPAVVGRTAEDAVHAIAVAYRSFALDHPGLYAALVPTTEVDDDAVRQTGAAVLETVMSVLRGYGLDDEQAVHAARTLRSAVHGFVTFELSGGFGLTQSPDDSFAWMTSLLAQAFRSSADRFRAPQTP